MTAGRAVMFDPDALRSAVAASGARSTAAKVREVAASFRCSIPTVMRAVKNRDTSDGGSKSTSGPAKVTRAGRSLPFDHPAMLEMTTIFPSMVFEVGKERLLKPGENSAKIGDVIRKGRWRGFPVYTLTLEERASCPASCELLASCYGNNTPFARRWMHGERLEWRLEREVAALELQHPDGFVVRLHNLGDFYSVGYVRLWKMLLERHRALHVFGYTAHVDTAHDEIAYEIAMMVREDDWTRFCVRFSNGDGRRCTTKTVEHPRAAPRDAFVCPAQTKRTESCATCAACWQTTKRVVFLRH